ncbi:RES family NAD+ phosphorylase [Chitinophaga lutea]
MKLFRLCNWEDAYDLSGLAENGRWNTKEDPCIYAFESVALCILENHFHRMFGEIPANMLQVEYEVPDSSIRYFEEEQLPVGWRSFPRQAHVRSFGSAILRRAETLLLAFPSVHWRGQVNYIINARHPLMAEVKILSASKIHYHY